MLSHLSTKFTQPVNPDDHEPRAALFLNRFTRTLSIMYATAGLEEVIGIPAQTMRGRSFYYCIAENCLSDAVKCLENAKSNDSIAYLRFWFRDPRVDDPIQPDEESDEEMTTEMSEDFDEGGGVDLPSTFGTSPQSASTVPSSTDMEIDVDGEGGQNSRTSSGASTNAQDTHEAIFGSAHPAHSSTSSLAQSPQQGRASLATDPIELEAVVSCTSDGLVVMLRRARPMIPHPAHRPSRPVYENGVFAAPWAIEPILPPIDSRAGAGFGTSFAPSLGPQGAKAHAQSVKAAKLASHDFMQAIREQAVFAWALTGINGSLAEFGQGKPLGESLPRDGLPIWASDPNGLGGLGDKAGMLDGMTKSPQDSRAGTHLFGDPGLGRGSYSSRSLSNSNSISNSNSHSGGGTPYPGR
nr:hypothetical protein CFP56_11184 [Quercus suber]